jgi:hypothetical protein
MRLAHAESDDPQVIINAEVFDEASGMVIAEQVFHFSLAGMTTQTDAQKRKTVTDPVQAWASEVEANTAKAAPLVALLGVAAPVVAKRQVVKGL